VEISTLPYNGTMKQKVKELRLRIPLEIFKEYRIVCTQLDLSMPKQTAAIITEFLRIQKENIKKTQGDQK
jgi:hypothetical protein